MCCADTSSPALPTEVEARAGGASYTSAPLISRPLEARDWEPLGSYERGKASMRRGKSLPKTVSASSMRRGFKELNLLKSCSLNLSYVFFFKIAYYWFPSKDTKAQARTATD